MAIIRKLYPGKIIVVDTLDYDWAKFQKKFEWINVDGNNVTYTYEHSHFGMMSINGDDVGLIATKYIYLVDNAKCGLSQ